MHSNPHLPADLLDTTPGSATRGVFTPPAGWEGSEQDYAALIRDRFDARETQARILFIIKYAAQGPVTCAGPYATMAARIIHRLVKKCGKECYNLVVK